MASGLSYRALLEAYHRRYGDGRGCYRRCCRQCGTMFYTGRPEAKYCRPACRQRAYRWRRRHARNRSSPGVYS